MRAGSIESARCSRLNRGCRICWPRLNLYRIAAEQSLRAEQMTLASTPLVLVADMRLPRLLACLLEWNLALAACMVAQASGRIGRGLDPRAALRGPVRFRALLGAQAKRRTDR